MPTISGDGGAARVMAELSGQARQAKELWEAEKDRETKGQETQARHEVRYLRLLMGLGVIGTKPRVPSGAGLRAQQSSSLDWCGATERARV